MRIGGALGDWEPIKTGLTYALDGSCWKSTYNTLVYKLKRDMGVVEVRKCTL